jgi:ATP-dependent Clp protease ATP-binding subunit ClpA
VVAGTQPRNALVGAAGVDTEHILLALLKSENCPAAKALANLDVDKVKLKSLVLNLSANAS